MSMKFFIGWDSREDIAYQVAKESLIANASVDVDVVPIKLQELTDSGLCIRAVDPLASTEFTYSRFLTPYLAGYKGWTIFCDCDFLFFGDVLDLQQYMDPKYAVCCVKHNHTPKETVKMDGAAQTIYPRKNWSSLMLFNCEHKSTMSLTPKIINSASPAYLHRMKWAKDEEIGSVPETWNWLEGWCEPPENGYPKAVHYTRGGPWFDDYKDVMYADEWFKYAEALTTRTSVSQ